MTLYFFWIEEVIDKRFCLLCRNSVLYKEEDFKQRRSKTNEPNEWNHNTELNEKRRLVILFVEEKIDGRTQ